MKVKIILMALCAALLLVSCETQALIIFDKTEHNFGGVKKDSTVSYTFTFTNRGSGTLVIERIKSG